VVLARCANGRMASAKKIRFSTGLAGSGKKSRTPTFVGASGGADPSFEKLFETQFAKRKTE